MTKPELVILAGPNGAGKTTFAQFNLKPYVDSGAFLNADDIARAVNPSDALASGPSGEGSRVSYAAVLSFYALPVPQRNARDAAGHAGWTQHRDRYDPAAAQKRTAVVGDLLGRCR